MSESPSTRPTVVQPPPVSLTWRSCLAIGVVGLLLAAGWYHTFAEIWSTRWFRMWRATDRPLWERLTEGDSYYTHGPLVPLICLFLAGYIYKRVGLPINRVWSATLVGWVGLIMCLLIHVLGVWTFMKFVSGMAFIAVLGCLILIFGGWRLARAYWAPVIFLVFMVPLPMDMIAGFNLSLKFRATNAALWLANHVFGVPAIRDGAFVQLADQKQLLVGNVCGGLRSIIALTFFASLFAVVCRVRGFWRVLMLVMALPIAFGSNVLRIMGLTVVAHYWTVDDAAKGSWFHDYSGLFVFVLALGALFLIEGGIMLLARLFKRRWVDQRLLPFLSKVGPAVGEPNFLKPAVLVVLAVAGGFALYLGAQPRAVNKSDRAKDAVRSSLFVGGELFWSEDMELSQNVLDILQTNDYVYRRFRNGDRDAGNGDKQFDLLIVFSTNIRNGAHSPDVCIEAAGEQIVAKSTYQCKVFDTLTVPLQVLETQRGRQQAYHYYVFKSGDTYTTSYIRQQLTVMINGLLSRNTAGALIRFTVPGGDGDSEEAKQLLADATEALMPDIERGLP